MIKQTFLHLTPRYNFCFKHSEFKNILGRRGHWENSRGIFLFIFIYFQIFCKKNLLIHVFI